MDSIDGYVVIDPKNGPLLWTISTNEEKCIERCHQHLPASWEEYVEYRKFHCIPITITERKP